MPGSAQASSVESAHGGFVAIGAAAELEAVDGGQLDAHGLAKAVEAGWLIPGGSLFSFELGVRGAVMTAAEAKTADEVGVFGGARVELMRGLGVGDVVPYLRGGLSVARLRLRIGEMREHRLGLGAYFGAGVAWEIWGGVRIAVEASAHPRIAPFTVGVGGAVVIEVRID